MKLLRLALVTLLLAGCQAAVIYTKGARVPANSVLHIKRDIRFGPDEVAIYIQKGRIVHPNNVDNYYPSCILELKKRTKNERVVRKDRFFISRVRYNADTAGTFNHSGDTMLTAIRLGGGSALSYVSYETVLHLRSPNQPFVSMLTCYHWEDPTDARHVTIKEINRTLRGYMYLETKRDK